MSEIELSVSGKDVDALDQILKQSSANISNALFEGLTASLTDEKGGHPSVDQRNMLSGIDGLSESVEVAGRLVSESLDNMLTCSPTDKSFVMLANSITHAFVSPNVCDSNFEPANLVDVVNYVARALHRIADSIEKIAESQVAK